MTIETKAATPVEPARHKTHEGLIAALRTGAMSDIWFDAGQFGDCLAERRIDRTKEGLDAAADKLASLDALRGRIASAIDNGEVQGPLLADLLVLMSKVEPSVAESDLAYDDVEGDTAEDDEFVDNPGDQP